MKCVIVNFMNINYPHGQASKQVKVIILGVYVSESAIALLYILYGANNGFYGLEM